VEDRDEELIIPVSENRVRSTFMEDFRNFIRSQVPPDRIAFDWKDPENDARGHYPVDCRVNGTIRPLFIYALPSDSKVKDATISLLTFERWGLDCRSLGIFEEQETINRHVLARFTDVCEKTFSSLAGETTRRIDTHLRRLMAAGGKSG
jgi:hypothetical protein